MKRYRYTGVTSTGAAVTGSIVGNTPRDADATLFARGILTLTVTPAPQIFRRASRYHLALVFRSIASLRAAGYPIPMAIATTEQEVAHPRLAPGLADTLRLIQQGESFAEAVAVSLDVPDSVIGLLRYGEESGQLEMALSDVASQLEAEDQAIAQLLKALAYPLTLIVAGCASMLLIVYFVLPRFTALLLDSGHTLPLSTRLVLFGADALRQYGAGMVAVIVAAVAILVRWIRITGRYERASEMVLRIPVIGPLRFVWLASRFCRLLGTQLSTGMPIVKALSATKAGITDPCISSRIQFATDSIVKGVGVAVAIRKARLVPSSVVPLIAIGESSGSLGAMLVRGSEFCDADAARRLRSLIGMIEPGLVVALGGGVALLAAAMLQAVYALRP